MKIALLLLCSLVSLWGAYYNYERVLHRVAGVHTTGTSVRNEFVPPHGSNKQWSAVVEYEVEGKTFEVHKFDGNMSLDVDYDVVYDPKDPSNSSLAATATDGFGIVIFLVVVAIGFAGLAIITFFSYSTGPRGSLRKPWP